MQIKKKIEKAVLFNLKNLNIYHHIITKNYFKRVFTIH